MRTRTIWIVAIIAALPFAFAWFALAASSVIRAPADERSLQVSINRTAGFGLLMDADCDHALTRCVVYDDSGGGASYAMTLRNRSCWEARLIEQLLLRGRAAAHAQQLRPPVAVVAPRPPDLGRDRLQRVGPVGADDRVLDQRVLGLAQLGVVCP